jgi:hypothetical protein
MTNLAPIKVTALPKGDKTVCMSNRPDHRGRVFEVELPLMRVPPGKRAILYLCSACAADLIVSTMV